MRPEYEGREQTWLKHRVLQEYVQSWAFKLSSVARHNERLWYVDCFAGPWQARNTELQDTSIYIGLKSLEHTKTELEKRGKEIKFGACFVESDDAAFTELDRFLESQNSSVKLHRWHGEFGDFVPNINRVIKTDPAFLFVDPTGWKGAAMHHIRPLATKPRRDVLVNVMFDHLNRHKDDQRTAIRRQIIEFFGLEHANLSKGLDEDELMGLYRSQLRKVCCLEHVADLVVSDPTKDRTKFRLVVGCHRPAGLELFRSIEKKVVGKESGAVRSKAKQRKREKQTSQLTLIESHPTHNEHYVYLNEIGLLAAKSDLIQRLEARPTRFEEIAYDLLERYHFTLSDLKQLVWRMRTHGQIEIEGVVKNQRTVRNGNLLRLSPPLHGSRSSQ